MIEEEEILTRTGPKWKTIFIIAFTVVAVSGMMYMLFTDEEYNKYNSPPATSATTSKEDSSEKGDSNTSVAETTPPKTITATTTASQDSAVATQPKPAPLPVAAPEEKKAVETKPVASNTKPVATYTPVTGTKPQQVPPKPEPVKVQPVPTKQKPVVVNQSTHAPNATQSTSSIKQVKPASPAPKPVAKPDKVLTTEELEQLARNIIEKGKSTGMTSKCVQLRSTTGGNNVSTMRQIEGYLRSQNFIMVGRSTVSAQINGIQVTPGDGGCMKVTVGSF